MKIWLSVDQPSRSEGTRNLFFIQVNGHVGTGHHEIDLRTWATCADAALNDFMKVILQLFPALILQDFEFKRQ
jgi:hypothetical protein